MALAFDDASRFATAKRVQGWLGRDRFEFTPEQLDDPIFTSLLRDFS